MANGVPGAIPAEASAVLPPGTSPTILQLLNSCNSCDFLILSPDSLIPPLIPPLSCENPLCIPQDVV
jgi:hypothetical protein